MTVVHDSRLIATVHNLILLGPAYSVTRLYKT